MKAYLEIEETEQLENAATCLRDRLLIRILARLGCRISEALAIKAKDIDFAQGTVTIERLKCRIGLSCARCGVRLGTSHAFCPKCGARVEEAVSKELEHRRIRILPLDSETLKMFRDYFIGQGTTTHEGERRIFGINRHRGWQVVRECAKRAGLLNLINPETGRVRGVSPHRLRDAFAVHAMKMDDSGDGLRLLQEHLGHASFNTTAKYRKVAGEEHKEWFERLWYKRGSVTAAGGKRQRAKERTEAKGKAAVQLELFKC